MFKIYVDDERPMPEGFHFIVRSNEQLHDLIHEITKAGGRIDTVSFDHDNMHGRDFYDGLVEFQAYVTWPDNLVFHTANPVAHKRMVEWAKENAPESTFVDPRFFWPGHLG